MKRHERGVGLIEVLVSLVLLAIAILGFAALQTRAISATSESALRVNALNTMRDLGDSVRYDIRQVDLYQDTLNDYTDDFQGKTEAQILAKEPSDDCGLYGGSEVCEPSKQTDVQAYKAAKSAHENGFKLKMADCPGTTELKCLIAAWNSTNAKIGTDAADCMDSAGKYKSGSECMVMEML